MKITNTSNRIVNIGSIVLLPDASTESVKAVTPAINALAKAGKLKVEETKITTKASAKKATEAKAETKTTETAETKSE